MSVDMVRVSIHASQAAQNAHAAYWVALDNADRAAYLRERAWEDLEKAAEAFGAKLVKIEQTEEAA